MERSVIYYASISYVPLLFMASRVSLLSRLNARIFQNVCQALHTP